MANSTLPLANFSTLGDLLKFLRRRAQLSQRQLAIAVGYSESHLSRIESNDRPLDRTTLLALFVPAMHLQDEPEVVARLLALGETAQSASSITALPNILPPEPTRQSAAHGHWPASLTSFVGRCEEMSEVSLLLADRRQRLITLTGAGGCGKTRLALRLGEALAHAYPQGVWLVELASLTDAHLLPKVVAATLAMGKDGADATLSQLADFLHAKQMLLLFDNCEHLIEAVAHLAAQLLQRCPQLQILATSREALGVPGEVNYRVHPLALPPAQRGAQPLAAAVAGYDAIRLFVERARATLPTFALNDQNAPAVARICQRLDGIPLGVELAAAWVNLLSPVQIADRLEQDFELLVDGHRLVLPRHQTLRAAIDWSYNLLTPAERRLLRWLSVFTGGWNLSAAEAVVSAVVGEAETTAGNQVLLLLNQLVNKSLVDAEQSSVGRTPSVLRARLLEPLREYFWAKLIQAGEEEQVRNRHLHYFVMLAERVAAGWTADPPGVGLVCLEQEQENLRAALHWSLTSRRAEEGLRLANALARFWRQRGHYSEGRRWLQAILAQAPASLPARPQALLWLGTLARLQGDRIEVQRLSAESLHLANQQGDQVGAAVALENLAWTYVHTDHQQAVAYFQESLEHCRAAGCQRQSGRLLTTLAQMAREEGNFERARTQLAEALAIARAVDDPQGIAHVLNGLSELASLTGEYDRAGQLLVESLALATASGSEQDLAWVHCGLAENSWHRGDCVTARQHGELSQRLFQTLGSTTGQAIVLHHLGLVDLTLGELEPAAHYFHKSLRLCQTANLRLMAARCLAGLAGVAVRSGMATQATQALATATACFAAHPHRLTPADETFYQQLVAESRLRLGEQAFAVAWQVGSALPVEAWKVCRLAENQAAPFCSTCLTSHAPHSL